MSVFAVHVGVFVVDEKEVVVVVLGEITLELLLDRLGAFELGHANELGEAFVHRVNRNAGGAEFVTIFEKRDVRLMRNAAHEETVGGLLAFQERERFFVKFDNQFGGGFLFGGLGARWLHRGNLQTFTMRIGVSERAFETFAAEDDDEAVAFAGSDDDFGGADLFDFAGEQGAEFLANFRFDAAGAAIGDDAIVVEGAEIGAGGDIAGFEIDAKAERFNDTAADLEFDRVVAKEREMAGATAGGDARGDRGQAALDGVAGERIQVRGVGGFEGCSVGVVAGGQVAEAVHNEEDEFFVGFECQFGVERVQIHKQRLKRRSGIIPDGAGCVK
jgi:hypothetical protein